MMVTTIYGEMDADGLELVETHDETDREVVEATEYWLTTESKGRHLVHRSVHVTIKHGQEGLGSAASLGG